MDRCSQSRHSTPIRRRIVKYQRLVVTAPTIQMNTHIRAKSVSFVFMTLIVAACLLANYPLLTSGNSSSILVQAQAPPPLPLVFSGAVTLNGSPAPDGLNVTAVDSGVVVGSAITSGGNYSLSACSPQNCNSGDTLSFMLNGQLTAAETTTVNTADRGIPQTQDLTFTGTLTSAQATAQQTTAPQTTIVTSVVTQVTSVATPEFPTVALSLLAALAVAFVLVRKKTRH